MLIRQSKNTFIRCNHDFGYITNQMTRFDRIYNDTGADFLKEISRIPQEIEDIVGRLIKLYKDVDYDTLFSDFMEFIEDLEKNRFVVIGDSPDELNAKDPDFCYSAGNPKTVAEDFCQEICGQVDDNTQDFMLDASQRRPRLNALQFELTSRCNERCIHCYIPNDKKDTGGDMPTKKVLSLIDEFADMGGIHITLSGGEVFLHKNIIQIMQYCREKDMQISILSNLIALKDNQIPAIKTANVSLIQVSLYSMVPEHHDYITTVKGSFEKTRAAIEKLVAADIPVQISCPLMQANKDDYRDVLKYAQSLNIKAQTDYIMMAEANFCTDNLANRLTLEQTEKVIRDIIEYDIDYHEGIEKMKPISDEIKFDLERFKKQPLCGAGINDCCITENGDVYPCAGWQSMVVGNVYQQSLKDIWENSEKLKMIRQITQGDFSQCLDCEARNFCAMCLVRNYNESNGDMFKINKHFCDVAFVNKKVVEEYYGGQGQS